MTRRIDKPDTDTDAQIRACIDSSKSFIMTAGAGSGKTTSLVKALGYIGKTHRNKLRRNKQRVACITYTTGAEQEILSEVENDLLFHVSTIHSFLWNIISPFQEDIKRWVIIKVEDKISDLKNKRENFSSRVHQSTRDKNLEETLYYEDVLVKLNNVNLFRYELGSRYEEGILGHDDIIKAGTWLILNKPLLRQIIAFKYPLFFVDESQDTFPIIVDSLLSIKNDSSMMIGFFGDPIQRIYGTGIGKIEVNEEWESITKRENFRNSQAVLKVINNIRLQADGIQQSFSSGNTDGKVFCFISQSPCDRAKQIEKCKDIVAEMTGDTLWNNKNDRPDPKILVIVHRMAANRLGFPSLFSAFNDGTSESLKDGFSEGDHWLLRPFLQVLAPLCISFEKNDQFSLISLLRAYSPLLDKAAIKRAESQERYLVRLKELVVALHAMFEPSSGKTIKEVLDFASKERLLFLDERISHYLSNKQGQSEIEGEEKLAQAISNYLSCSAHEMIKYYHYIENESPYSTQHGVKGAEFERVIVILDDEEGRGHTQYSYEKLLQLKDLSKTDLERIEAGEDSVLDRTRRLFYVCCSRAMKDLCIVLFTGNPQLAYDQIFSSGLFEENSIQILEC